MSIVARTRAELEQQIEDLRRRLAEAEQTILAIRSNAVDAFVVEGATDDHVLLVKGCDRPYRLLVERMQQGAATVTSDGSVYYANPHFCRLVGRDAHAIRGVRVNDLLATSADRDRFGRILTEMGAHGASCELNVLSADGTTFPALVTVSPLLNEVDVYCLLLADLTPQRMHEEDRAAYLEERAARAEAERMATLLRQSEERLEDLVRARTAELAAANAKYQAMYDQGLFAALVTPEGTIVDANRSAIDDCGFTRDEVIGKLFWEAGWWRASEGVQAWLRAGFAKALAGQPFTGETLFYCADGCERVMDFALMPIKDDTGKTVYVLPTGMDITERRRAERERRAAQVLRESEQRYRNLVQNLPVAVYLCDAEGHLRLYNEAAVELWGRRPAVGEELWCGSYQTYFPDGRRVPPEQIPMTVCLRERRPIRGREIIIERPDGSRRYILPNPTPIFDVNGKLVGAVNVLLDITERKRAEAELASTKDDLELQVEALTRLHELAVRLAETLDLESALQAILETTVELCEADFGLLSLYDPVWGFLRPGASYGIDANQLALFSGTVPGNTSRSCGAAFATRTRTIVEDTETDPMFENDRELARTVGFRSVHSTPILTRSGEVIGVLSVKSKQCRLPTQRDTQIADVCARHAGDAIEAARNQQALRESEQRFRMMADTAPAMLWISDVKGLRTFVSRAWYEFTGQPDGTALGLGWAETVHPDDRLNAIQAFLTANARREDFQYEYRMIRHDGQYRWIVNTARPRFDANGVFLGYIGSLFDITDRKNFETRLREANDTLERRVEERTRQLRDLALELSQAEQRERKRLARVLHDEVQQLLVAVKMHAAFARRGANSGAAIDEVQRLADEAIAACRALVIGLSPPVLHDNDLPDTLEWLARFMEDKYGLHVHVEIAEELPPTTEDLRTLLFEVVRELLLNVVKHAGVHEARVRAKFEHGFIVIDVWDDGRGCDTRQLNQPARDSFGLFSIRERLAVLGGSLRATGRPGRGCEFVVSVPI